LAVIFTVMFTKFLLIIFAELTVSAVTARASSPTGLCTIQGVVRDSKAQPIAGAELHIQAKGGTDLAKTVRTDASGRYIASRLPNTDYEVVLFVNGSLKASINNTKTLANKPTQLDFKLTSQFAANKLVKKHTHMVYVPAETGSHLGGHWVEVDDNGDNAGAFAGSANVKKGNSSTIKGFQTNSGGMGNVSPFGGP
jgi:Carboxypeptidase regulatory-like domain